MCATAAAAVVLAPLLSSIIDTRKLPKKRCLMASNSASPSATLLPVTNRAVNFLLAGARVKTAPSTRRGRSAGRTPPTRTTWSAPPS